MKDTLRIIGDIKDRTGAALAGVLEQRGLSNCSEKNLADAWLTSLRRHPECHEDGWYAPPPQGVIALFGKPHDRYGRICPPSFRPESMWPDADRFYDDGDMVAVYASPIHRATGLIGDFGLTLYPGSSSDIRDHCAHVLKAGLHIARSAKVDMPFKDLYAYAMDYGVSQGFSNDIASSSDKAGTNIGHTIPLSWPGDPAHAAMARAKAFDDVKEILRVGRIFVNGAETQRIGENMAFTVEPRFSTMTLPQAWFHLTVIFENGEQRICHGFDPVFRICGMETMLKLLP